MKRIAVFASGAGTNAEKIIRHFSTVKGAEVSIIMTNNSDAPVIERAKKLGVKVVIFDRNDLYVENRVLAILKDLGIDFIVLAGFLWLIPPSIVREYRRRIINIHPALLPSYGGKGMYGEKVHRAVLENGERISGITIHFVDEVYDSGDIIFQAETEVLPTDSPSTLAARIHGLEHKYFPIILERLIAGTEPSL